MKPEDIKVIIKTPLTNKETIEMINYLSRTLKLKKI